MITKTLKKKGTVKLVGFGAFKETKMKARRDRNPQADEAIKIRTKNSKKFAAGKALKEAVK